MPETVLCGFDQTGSKCSGHPQRGTLNLDRALRSVFAGGTAGIYACRPPRGQTTGLSEHGEGRADDYIPPGTVGSDAYVTAGWRIAKLLVTNACSLGVEEVIWQRKIWSWPRRAEGWRDYHGQDPHTGHIHAGQNWSGALWLLFDDAVAVLSSHTPQPPTPASDESELSMLPRCVHWQGAICLVGYDTGTFSGTLKDAQGNVVDVPSATGPWLKVFPNLSKLEQIVGGGGCVTDRSKATSEHPWGVAFEVTNPQFEQVYVNRGAV